MSELMKTDSLSHPRAVTVIKDPIHDAITLTCFEREIVDSEHFQRLHFILQNSTTYVAFPSNKNSRFSHSLGVSHTCGELFTKALRNATPQDLNDFLENAGKFTAKMLRGRSITVEDHRSAWKQTISGHSGYRHRPSLRKKGTNDPVESVSMQEHYPKEPDPDGHSRGRVFSAGFLVDTLWEAVRICGLVHDIGHLPMSHSLEGALDKFLKKTYQQQMNAGLDVVAINDLLSEITCEKKYHSVFNEFSIVLGLAYPHDNDFSKLREAFAEFPVHEKRSLFILQELFDKGIYKFQGIAATYRELIYNIAFLILLSSVESDQAIASSDLKINDNASQTLLDNSAFRFLKLIIAGSVDGDRMDYTIRDGLSCGSKIGNYDLSEIVESATLFRNKSNEFRMGFFYRALPAIEQFFNQRYQGYKYLIYHRTSSRTETCLQYVMSALIEFCYLYPEDKISIFFQNLGYMAKSENGNHRIFPIYLDTELHDKKSGPAFSQIPMLDDANLRSFLQWTLHQINNRKHSSSNDKINKLRRIDLLLRIFLNREFQHIFDPFKDISTSVLIKNAFVKFLNLTNANLIDVEFNEARKLFFLSDDVREEIINEFGNMIIAELRKNFESDIDIQFIYNEQKPKVYNHQLASKKGEEVYLVYNEVDKKGYVPVRALVDASSYIKDIEDNFFKEFKINCYFVSENIKSNGMKETIIKHINHAMLKSTEMFVEKLTADNH